jgi:hypothetical protein
MRRQGVPFGVIAERLNMSLGAVQKAARRGQKEPVGAGLGPRAGRHRPRQFGRVAGAQLPGTLAVRNADGASYSGA